MRVRLKCENKVRCSTIVMLGRDTGKSYLIVRLDMREAFRKHYAHFYIEVLPRCLHAEVHAGGNEHWVR